MWWKGPQRRRRGGDARPVLPHPPPAEEKGKKVAWIIAWIALVMGILMTLLPVLLPT